MPGWRERKTATYHRMLGSWHQTGARKVNNHLIAARSLASSGSPRMDYQANSLRDCGHRMG